MARCTAMYWFVWVSVHSGDRMWKPSCGLLNTLESQKWRPRRHRPPEDTWHRSTATAAARKHLGTPEARRHRTLPPAPSDTPRPSSPQDSNVGVRTFGGLTPGRTTVIRCGKGHRRWRTGLGQWARALVGTSVASLPSQHTRHRSATRRFDAGAGRRRHWCDWTRTPYVPVRQTCRKREPTGTSACRRVI